MSDSKIKAAVEAEVEETAEVKLDAKADTKESENNVARYSATCLGFNIYQPSDEKLGLMLSLFLDKEIPGVVYDYNTKTRSNGVTNNVVAYVSSLISAIAGDNNDVYSFLAIKKKEGIESLTKVLKPMLRNAPIIIDRTLTVDDSYNTNVIACNVHKKYIQRIEDAMNDVFKV